ncbi:hypothetical protein WN55_10140 [Dufourea novaeangliae]|uniref:Uncharacterized protein n=1 Tax=Dufourea novaeangliae TaxID=178035 RepID=A0A154P2Y1_DUFNO|nr:hypothetical protein WN55_10140 [Dufourea novaeangliae]
MLIFKEPVETYDPWKHTETRSIIRSMPGGSKSKKKEFKVAERKRLQALETVNTFKPTLTTQFKHKEVRKSTNILELIKKMRRLSLDEFDILLQSIDISKLLISDIEDSKERCMSEVVEKMLVQKLKELMLHCLKKESF